MSRTVKRWSVVLVGVGLFAVATGGAVATGHPLFVQPQALAVLAAVSLVVVLAGAWLARRGSTPADVAVVAAWIAGAVLTSGLLGTAAIGVLVGGFEQGLAVGAGVYLGTVGGTVGILLGVNDVRRREQAARARTVSTAVEHATDAVAIVDADGGVSLVNDAFVDLYGFDSEDDLVGTDWRTCYDDETVAELESEALPTLRREGTWRGETTGRRADGTTFPQDLSLTMLEAGQIVAIVRDVTERREREREIERLALEGTGTGTWEWTIETGEVTWNDRLEALVGLDPGGFEGTFEAFADRVHEEDLPAVEAAVEEALENDEPYHAEFRMDRADGSTLWVEGRGNVVGEGEDRRMIGLITDISDRKRRQTALEEASSRLQLALGGASPAIWEYDLETGTITWNQSMAELLNFEPGEFDGDIESFMDLIHPEDQETVVTAIQEARESEGVYTIMLRVADADGEYRWLDLRGKQVTDEDDRERMVGLARDVTERERYRRELEKRRDAIETLLESAREMIDAPDTGAVCRAAVQAAQRALDAPLVTVWLADETGERLEPVASTEAARDRFDELPTYTAEDDSHSWQAFESGDVAVTTDTSGTDHVANPGTPVRNEIVLPVGEYGVMNVGTTGDRAFDEVDVYVGRLLASNAVAALERAQREDELRHQTDQLEFFNSILRHDVLNGMTVIQARAEILADELETGQHREYAATIESWSRNVTEVTKRVQRVLETLTAPEETTSLEPVDVASLVDEHVERLQSTHPEATFETDCPASAVVTADELLSDVLGNLLTNAIEHNESADLTVRATVDVGPDVTTLRIADDGEGVPDDRKESVFRRGETGHAKETGSGFGLFFVDAMVSRYGGAITIEDNEDGGATFVVELPTVYRDATDPDDPDAEPGTDEPTTADAATDTDSP